MERLPQYYRCGECEMAPASVDCRDCSESYCADCNASVHSKGKRAEHTNSRRIFVCQRCNAAPATQACGDCEGKVFCERCNTRLHGSKGKHRKHQPTVKPVAEYYATAGGKAPAVDKDVENGLGLKVGDLVASPQRFHRTAAAVEGAMHDTEDAAAEGTAAGDAAENTDPLAGGADGASAAAPPPVKFTDAETQRLLVGDESVADRVWGWRRLSRIFPEGSLFDTGNKALRTKCPRPEPDFPSLSDPAVAEAIGRRGAADEAEAADGVHAQVETLPRFPVRPPTVALDERAVNLAVLAVALAGTSAPFARLFHSVEYRATGLYSLQFFTDATRPEAIRDAAVAAGMPLNEQSPARARPGAAAPSSQEAEGGLHQRTSPRRGAAAADAESSEALSPRRQYEALLAATGAGNGAAPSVAFLRDAFEKQSVPVEIDDLVPVGKDGRPIFGLTDQPGELWRAVLGKGLAKFYGSYAALEHVNPVAALRTLTGARVTAESWGGSGECLDLFPDIDAAARFVWWRVAAAKRLGQMCWFTRSRDAPGAMGTDGGQDDDYAPDNADRDRDLEDAEAAAGIVAAPGGGESPAASPQALPQAEPEPLADAAAETAPEEASAAIGGGAAKEFSVPVAWGTEQWATAQGASAEVADAAVAIHTAELTVRAANNSGMRREACAAPPSADGWQLVKLNQLAGDLGAERFSYAHFSGQWTKDLRERFDFKSSDSDVVMGTPEDLAECFDTVTCCSGYVGAPPSANFVLLPSPTEHDARDNAQRLLVVLRPGVTQLAVTNAAAFDLRTARAAPATTALHLVLHPVASGGCEAFLALPTTFDNAEAAAAQIPVPPVLAVNVALGISDRVPDQFLVRGLVCNTAATAPPAPKAEASGAATAEGMPAPSDVGRAFVLTVVPSYHTEAYSVALGFKNSEVAFVKVL